MKDIYSLFMPKSVAVIGASNKHGKVGNMVMKNLRECKFNGNVYPINPKEEIIEGLKVFHSILDVPEDVDLVIISVPSSAVNESARQCAQKHVKTIIVLTAGFKEIGAEGEVLEKELVEICQENNINLLGPNCLGILDTHYPLNASFSQLMPDKGNIAFISQSGAMMVAIIDWSKTEGIGFSKVISIGNMSDLSEIDLIKYLSEDDKTSVILCYLEGVTNGKEFMDVIKDASKKKPIIILKSGSSQAGAKAASSHTGALAGSDSSFDAAFGQTGVVRASTMQDLFDYGFAFSKCKLPKGKNVGVITNAGGGGVISADSIEKFGLNLAQLSDETKKILKETLPAESNTQNPVDVLGDAPPERYRQALEIVSKDPNVDSLIVITCPTAAADPIGIGKEILKVKDIEKPIIVVNMGGVSFESINVELRENGLPTYVFPETAVKAMSYMTRYSEFKNSNSVSCLENIENINYDKVKEIINNVYADGRKALLGSEAYAVASAYGINTAPIILTHSDEEGANVAKEIGFPVVLKIASDKILHKTDIGGVRVNINNWDDAKWVYNEILDSAKHAYPDVVPNGIEVQKMLPEGQEIIVGMIRDSRFGPMIAFGMGGIYVNLIKDVCFKVAKNITDEDIEKQIKNTKAYTLLNGYRGSKPCNVEAVKDIIKRISKLTLDFEEIAELDINPIIAYENESVAIDVKITLK